MRQYHWSTDLKIIVSGAIVCVALSGCAAQVKPEPPKACEPVEVPVEQYCDVQIPVIPASEFDKTTKDDLLTKRIKALMIDRQVSKDYQQVLLETIKACLKPEAVQ